MSLTSSGDGTNPTMMSQLINVTTQVHANQDAEYDIRPRIVVVRKIAEKFVKIFDVKRQKEQKLSLLSEVAEFQADSPHSSILAGIINAGGGIAKLLGVGSGVVDPIAKTLVGVSNRIGDIGGIIEGKK